MTVCLPVASGKDGGILVESSNSAKASTSLAVCNTIPTIKVVDKEGGFRCNAIYFGSSACCW